MKRFFLLIFLLLNLLVSFGCSNSEKVSVVDDFKNSKKESLKYHIEQISFSKSFQSLGTAVEIIENNEKSLKILAQLGLSDYTNIKVHKILMKKNNVDIYVSGSKESDESLLSVPHVIFNLDKDKINEVSLEDIKFNLVYEDYEAINIKFKINDVLNKLESHFKISTNSSPRFNLINIDGNTIWEITYDSIFYKDMEDTPLINLHALVDANTGDIIESEKNLISSVLDNGHILNYIENKNLLYRQAYNDKENKKLKEKLYIYDIINEEKILLYTSNYNISSGQIAGDSKHVSFIETSENGNEVLIASYDNPKVYKIVFEGDFNPYLIKWKDNNILYIMGSKNSNSLLYAYDTNSNQLELISKINKEIEAFNAFGDYFLLIEKSESEYNKKTYLTKDWKEFKSSNTGFNFKFIDGKNIAYIKKDEQSNIDYLSIYNLEEEELVRRIDGSVVSYSIFDGKIIYIKNNPSYNDYTMYSYSIATKEKSPISHIICKNVFYNDKDNLIYLNATLPFENNNTEMIYSIDLNDSKNPKDM